MGKIDVPLSKNKRIKESCCPVCGDSVLIPQAITQIDENEYTCTVRAFCTGCEKVSHLVLSSDQVAKETNSPIAWKLLNDKARKEEENRRRYEQERNIREQEISKRREEEATKEAQTACKKAAWWLLICPVGLLGISFAWFTMLQSHAFIGFLLYGACAVAYFFTFLFFPRVSDFTSSSHVTVSYIKGIGVACIIYNLFFAFVSVTPFFLWQWNWVVTWISGLFYFSMAIFSAFYIFDW